MIRGEVRLVNGFLVFSDTIKDRLSKVILTLFDSPGLKTNGLGEKLAVSEITIKRFAGI